MCHGVIWTLQDADNFLFQAQEQELYKQEYHFLTWNAVYFDGSPLMFVLKRLWNFTEPHGVWLTVVAVKNPKSNM
jgi:hypothetical protein